MSLPHRRHSWPCLLLCAAAVALVPGCSSPDEDEDPTEVTSLTGTITGTIQDGNGTPIAGVDVRYSGGDGPLQATTDANGQFEMPGVTVTGVSSTTAPNDANGPIQLLLVPPAGYMGGTVEVNPQAQSTGSPGGGTVFIDEFNVDIGPVRLPGLNTTIVGVLRDQTTGGAVAGASLVLDFQGVEFDQGSTVGVLTSYNSGSNRLTTSDASGNFSFSGVYDDACLRLSVGNYDVQGASGAAAPCSAANPATDPTALYLSTANEGSTLNLANVTIVSFASGDAVAPYVASVDGVVAADETPAPLESRITGVSPNDFRIRFSEPLQAIVDPSDVIVALGTAPNQTAAALAGAQLDPSNPNTVVVSLQNPLPAGTPVDVRILREALKDGAGNSVALSEAIAYDSRDSQLLTLSFITFSPQNATADAATVTPESRPVDAADPALLATNALLDTVAGETESIRDAQTPSSTSVPYAADAAVEQLNNPAAADALNALLDAVDGADTRNLSTGVARMSIAVPANAASFLVWIERAGIKLDVLFHPVFTGTGNPQNTAFVENDGPTYLIVPNGASSFDLIALGRTSEVVLQPGDVFHIVSRNSAGLLGGEATLTLIDIGRPSVALQEINQLIAASEDPGGSGSGIVVTPDSPRTVLLALSPQVADVNDTEAGLAEDHWRGPSELQGLSDPALQGSALAQSLEGTDRAIGDADGTAAFLQVQATLAVSITEPGTYTGTAPSAAGVEGVALGSFAVQNDVASETAAVSDVLVFDADPVFGLVGEATDKGASLDLTGAIVDLNALAPDAATRAVVALRDYMPPLMQLAFYDGSNFVFRFNEPVRALGTIVLTPCNVTIVLNSTADANADGTPDVQHTDPSTFVVQGHVAPDPAACFALPAYAEDSYSAEALAGLTTVTPNPLPPHGAVTYAGVPDTAANEVTGDNTWTDWVTRGLGIGSPMFAAANITPAP